MPKVHILSQIRPGLRMGMGHYERLLIWHLMKESSREEWQFAYTCDGRIPKEAWQTDISQHPGFVSRDSLGIANVRFLDWPWSVVNSAMNLRFKNSLGGSPQSPGSALLFHSLALDFPAPTTRPSIYSIHDLPPTRFSDEGRLPKWSKQAVKDARFIFTPSHFARREVIEHLEVAPERVVVVPCGVEREHFNLEVPVADRTALSQLGIEMPFLIYVGGVSQRKNVPVLLEAWKRVAPNHPGLQLVMVGPDTLKDLVREANAPRTVTCGYMGRDTLPSVMRAAKALVFPSIYEGFGLPPQEALAMGVPVIATKVAGAVPEVVGDAGLLSEDGTAEALAHTIETFLRDPNIERELRQKGPQRAQTFWSWSEHASTVLGHYRTALS